MPAITPSGVAAVPWFLMVAENKTGWPTPGIVGDHVKLVTMRSGRPPLPTVSVFESVLLFSLLSAMRLTSSTNAWTVCVPAVAVHILPLRPQFAERVTDDPPAIYLVSPPDMETEMPST